MLADFLAADGVLSWEERRPLVAEALSQARADIIGLQEAMPAQSAWLRSALPDLTMVPVISAVSDQQVIETVRRQYGIEMSDSPAPYEVATFFRTASFDLLDSGWWWLSPTPDRPSVGFGNVAPRVLQWLKLRHAASGCEIVAANTHIDWRSSFPMLSLCRNLLDSLVENDLPVIFLGDLNVAPGSVEYQMLLEAGWQDADAEDAAEAYPQTVPASPPDPLAERIDHILYRGTSVIAQDWHRLPSPNPNYRLSDHDPVGVTLRLPPRPGIGSA
jgi:endonuclease/exonuclease/phosphatase family metal-dependent hydrolase